MILGKDNYPTKLDNINFYVYVLLILVSLFSIVFLNRSYQGFFELLFTTICVLTSLLIIGIRIYRHSNSKSLHRYDHYVFLVESFLFFHLSKVVSAEAIGVSSLDCLYGIDLAIAVTARYVSILFAIVFMASLFRLLLSRFRIVQIFVRRCLFTVLLTAFSLIFITSFLVYNGLIVDKGCF